MKLIPPINNSDFEKCILIPITNEIQKKRSIANLFINILESNQNDNNLNDIYAQHLYHFLAYHFSKNCKCELSQDLKIIHWKV